MSVVDPRQIDSVLVFDLDDTLYLERRYVESGLRAVGRWARRQLGIAGLETEMLRRFRNGSRGHLFDEALANAGFISNGLVQRMLVVYRQHSPEIALEPDAARLLRIVPPRTAVAVLTDGYLDAQKRKIRALDLHRCGLRVAVCTDRWGKLGWKPALRGFEYLQGFFKLPASSFTYVADNVCKDFHAPKRLGWKTVHLARPDRLHKTRSLDAVDADVAIQTLDDMQIESSAVDDRRPIRAALMGSFRSSIAAPMRGSDITNKE